MFRWACSISLASLAAFAVLVTSTPPLPPSQPIQFSHKQHLDYLRDPGSDGHRESMALMHEKLLMEALEDRDIVDPMIEMVKGGNCTLCHGDFDENVENMAKLGHCAQCHRYFLEHDWEGPEEAKPCMACHHTDNPSRLSIPNADTCAACHLPPLGDGAEEAILVDFIGQEDQQKRKIPWVPVYDYLPGSIVFSHQRHTELGGVKCQECHGDVEAAEQPLSLKEELSMEKCMSCHQDHVIHHGDEDSATDDSHEAEKPANDCLACHK